MINISEVLHQYNATAGSWEELLEGPGRYLQKDRRIKMVRQVGGNA